MRGSNRNVPYSLCESCVVSWVKTARDGGEGRGAHRRSAWLGSSCLSTPEPAPRAPDGQASLEKWMRLEEEKRRDTVKKKMRACAPRARPTPRTHPAHTRAHARARTHSTQIHGESAVSLWKGPPWPRATAHDDSRARMRSISGPRIKFISRAIPSAQVGFSPPPPPRPSSSLLPCTSAAAVERRTASRLLS